MPFRFFINPLFALPADFRPLMAILLDTSAVDLTRDRGNLGHISRFYKGFPASHHTAHHTGVQRLDEEGIKDHGNPPAVLSLPAGLMKGV